MADNHPKVTGYDSKQAEYSEPDNLVAAFSRGEIGPQEFQLLMGKLQAKQEKGESKGFSLN